MSYESSSDKPLIESPVPIERKVVWGTVGSYVGSVSLLWLLQGLQADVGIIGPLPDFIEALIVAMLPTVVTALAAYRARHTWRVDHKAIVAARKQGYRPTSS